MPFSIEQSELPSFWMSRIVEELEESRQAAAARGEAFLIYRLPGDEEQQIISSPFSLLNEIPKEVGAGFIIHPFEVQNHSPIVWIDYSAKQPSRIKVKSDREEISQTQFTAFIRKAKETFSEGQLEKVVASRPIYMDAKEDWSIVEYYLRMAEKYPDVFVYLVCVPDIGTWLGASPEVLLQADQKSLRTVALAGTKASETEAWGDKEIEEQAIVSRYMRRCLEDAGFKHVEESDLETVKAGKIYHLKTTFSAKSSAGQDLLGIAASLHPSPAVAGLPKRAACDFISQYEHYDRRYYTGFIGPVNMDDRTYLAVNLRCLEQFGSQICFYVGAGITKDSDAEKEWQETMLKADTLLSLFANNSEIEEELE